MELENAETLAKCLICYENYRTVVNNPCKHIVTCYACSQVKIFFNLINI